MQKCEFILYFQGKTLKIEADTISVYTSNQTKELFKLHGKQLIQKENVEMVKMANDNLLNLKFLTKEQIEGDNLGL